MSQSAITILIILCTCVLYLTEKLPVALVTVMGMLAMVFTGVLSYSDAFNCFASTNVMLVLGMIIITPLPIAAAMVIVVALCYWFFLYDLQKKWFDFPEEPAPIENDIEEIPLDKRKATICITVFAICILLFIFQPFGWSLGLISITGAVVMVLAGCVDGKHALKHMQWSALVTLGAALAIAKGFVESGVGEIIMEKLTAGLGSWVVNPVLLVTLFLVSGFILSQFMANGALVSMMAAIAVPMAMEIGMDPMPVALACVFGCSLAMATPVATTTITMVQVAGYRFRDYLRAGGLTSLIALVTAWVAIVLRYRLIL